MSPPAGMRFAKFVAYRCCNGSAHPKVPNCLCSLLFSRQAQGRSPPLISRPILLFLSLSVLQLLRGNRQLAHCRIHLGVEKSYHHPHRSLHPAEWASLKVLGICQSTFLQNGNSNWEKAFGLLHANRLKNYYNELTEQS